MRKVGLILFVIFFAFISCSKAENDPDKILDRARVNFKKGNYEDALKDHIWYHDNALKYKPSLYGVRLSFALSDWVRLGQKYPPALAKLKEIRDIKTDRIITGDGSLNLFHDVESINSHLEESQKTVQLFKAISNKYPELGIKCYRVAKDALIEYKKFKICSEYLRKPLDKLGNMKDLLASDLEMYKGSDMEERITDWTIKHYLEESEQIIIILTNNNRIDEAGHFLAEAKKDIDIQKIIRGLQDIENKYLANKAITSD
jgi:hypothetical protein